MYVYACIYACTYVRKYVCIFVRIHASLQATYLRLQADQSQFSTTTSRHQVHPPRPHLAEGQSTGSAHRQRGEEHHCMLHWPTRSSPARFECSVIWSFQITLRNNWIFLFFWTITDRSVVKGVPVHDSLTHLLFSCSLWMPYKIQTILNHTTYSFITY